MGIHDGHREKMRRRFLETGLEGFADHEALELLLYYAIPRRDTNPIAHALMERYDSLSGVLNAPVEDLEKVEGIGESAAILLSLVSRLSRKARIADASQETILNSSERAGAYLLERFAGERRELVFLLCLDRKGRLLACKRLAEGDVASADLNIRKVVEMALLTSASVAVSGMIGWVGLVIPHFCRMLFGYDYRRLIPAGALFGAAFLLAVDDIARLVTTGELPLGILTAFVGAPLFLYLIATGGGRRVH